MQSSTTDKLFLKLATLTLVFLYLVILAGSVVRATGSGMGCPDWPKCFGYFIPPTDPSQVEFHENHLYEKNMMIIVSDTVWLWTNDIRKGKSFGGVRDTLWRAKEDFTSGKTFNRANWEKYPVHDYAKFYVRQTWTEYINRLLGALSGFFTFLLFAIAIFRWKKDTLSIVLLLFGIFILAFIGWMGKVVVDSNLKPAMITFHMMSALAMVSIVIFTQWRVRVNAGLARASEIPKSLKLFLVAAIGITLTQIIFGTQVRQQIDVINSNMSGLSRETWISQLKGVYPVHMIIAVIVLLVNGFLFFKLNKIITENKTKRLLYGILLIMLAEYGVGVFIHNFGIPAFAQPIHLFLAMILFGIQFGLVVRTKSLQN
jgi:cytochrome c oxidase assembly protein subunit 15